MEVLMGKAGDRDQSSTTPETVRTSSEGARSVSVATSSTSGPATTATGIRFDALPHQRLSNQESTRSFTVKTSDLGTYDGRPKDLELWLARVDALLSSESDPGYERALVRAMLLALRGEAALWHQSLSVATRISLCTIARWREQLREVFKPPDDLLRSQSYGRTWQPDKETAVYYTFSTAALLKAAFPGLEDDKMLVDIAAGLPNDIGQKRMTYKLPENIIWCNRPCRICGQEHFDFSHDYCCKNEAHVGEVEEAYPITGADF